MRQNRLKWTKIDLKTKFRQIKSIKLDKKLNKSGKTKVRIGKIEAKY